MKEFSKYLTEIEVSEITVFQIMSSATSLVKKRSAIH